MKKLLILSVLSTMLLSNEYQSNGEFSSGTKLDACKRALDIAKENALAQAGSMVISDFTKSTKIDGDKYSLSRNKELKVLSLGTVKVLSKDEKVEVTKDYQFYCKVNGTFSIDTKEMKTAYEKYLKKDKVQSQVFTAVGYSEEGQSRIRAIKAAQLDARRNLIEQVKGSDILARTITNEGILDKDQVINTVSGNLRYIKTVSQEYDKETRSAIVKISLSYEDLQKQLNR